MRCEIIQASKDFRDKGLTVSALVQRTTLMNLDSGQIDFHAIVDIG